MAQTTASLVVRIAADLSSFKKGMSDAESQMVKTGARLQSLGESLTAAVTLPFVALAGVTAKLAADNEASIKKLEHTFGTSAANMEGFITNLMKTVPATSEELRNLTSNTDVFFRSIGLGIPQATSMTQAVTKLAGDLAAFNHVSIDVAQSSLQQALAGQTRGLREFGIAINETDVKNRAYSLGLAQVGDNLSHAATVQATWSLILDRTKQQQGEAARTIGDNANALARLKQASEEAAVAFGNLLAPTLARAADALTGFLKSLNDLPSGTKSAVIGVGAIVAAIGPALFIVGSLTEKIILLNRALAILGAGSALSGIAKIVTGLGPILALLSAPIAAVIYAFAKQGEGAKQTAADLDLFTQSLNNLTVAQLKQQQAADQALLASIRAQQARVASQITNFDATKFARPADAMESLNAQNSNLAEQARVIQTNVDAITAKLKQTGVAAGDSGGEGVSLADMLKHATEHAQNVIAAFDLMKEKFGPIAGFGASLTAALIEVQNVLAKIPNAMDPMRIKLEQIAQTIKNDILGSLSQLANLAAPGSIPLTSVQAAAPGLGPIPVQGPGQITQLGGVVFKAPEVAAIPPELQNVNATLARVKDGLDAGLLGIANSLTFALSGLAQAFVHGQGSQIGASIGAAGGSAALGAAVGKMAGSGIGAAFGNAIVPVIGGIAGAALGGLIGGLFDHHKKSVDNSAASLDALSKTVNAVTASISNIPQFFKIESYRYAAAPIPIPGVSPSNPPSAPAGVGGTTGPYNAPIGYGSSDIHVHGNVTIQAADAKSARDLYEMMKREALKDRGTNSVSAFAFQGGF